MEAKADRRPSRLNIEAEVFSDPRYLALVQRVGQFTALGMLGHFWRAAQLYYKRGAPMPREHFDVGGFQPLLEVGYAKECDGGIRAAGEAEQFGWLRARRGAGSEGGKARAQANASKGEQTQANASKRKQTPSKRKQTQANAKQTQANASKRKQTPSKLKPPTPTPTPTPIHTHTHTHGREGDEEPEKTAHPTDRPIPIDDEKLRDWLDELGVSGRGIEAMIGEYGRDRVLKGLRDAYVGFQMDPGGFFTPPPGKLTTSRITAVAMKLRSYVANARDENRARMKVSSARPFLPPNLPELE